MERRAAQRWSTVFVFAGLFNLAPGFGLLFAPDLLYMVLGLGAPGPRGYYPALAGLLIIGFGICYFLASRDPASNRNIVLAGALAKAGVFVLSAIKFKSGDVPLPLLVVAAFDLVWAAIFLRFLTSQQPNSRSTGKGTA